MAERHCLAGIDLLGFVGKSLQKQGLKGFKASPAVGTPFAYSCGAFMNSVKDKSILVLDDDIAMLRALARVLTEEGAIISKASSLEEALRYLSGNDGTFDLVITDLSVRDISGTGVLEALKAKLPEVPILVITAFGNPELRAQCLLQGAADFLEKPLNAVDLIAGISRVLASCGNRVQLAAPCVREVR